MKYLVIAAVVILLLLFVYSRLRPYIKLIGKALGILKGIADGPAATNSARRTPEADRKLVRCVACGTWVPAERVVGSGSGAAYCSRECLENSSRGGERRAAG